MDKTLQELLVMIREVPGETIPEYGEIPDLARLSNLPLVPDKDKWWQDIRNAYGLHTTLLRDLMVKHNNFVAMYQRNMEALLTIIQSYADMDSEDVTDDSDAQMEKVAESIADMVDKSLPEATFTDTLRATPDFTPEVEVKEDDDPFGLKGLK